jgi:hypothetical protein
MRRLMPTVTDSLRSLMRRLMPGPTVTDSLLGLVLQRICAGEFLGKYPCKIYNPTFIEIMIIKDHSMILNHKISVSRPG